MSAMLESIENEREIPKSSSFGCIPSFIMEDDYLDEGAKVLYARISMYSTDGRCWASNSHFAEKHKVSIRCIQNWLSQLCKAGYIEVEIIKEAFSTRRNIWLIIDFKKIYKSKKTTRIDEIKKVNTTCKIEQGGDAPDFMHINIKDTNINKTTTFPPPKVFSSRDSDSVGGFSSKENKTKPPVIESKASKEIKPFECLKDVQIKDADKQRLSKDYPEEIVKKAIAYCTKLTFKPTKSLDCSIFYFCKNPDQIVLDKEQIFKVKQSEQDKIQETISKNRYFFDELRKKYWNHVKEYYKKTQEYCLRENYEYATIGQHNIYYQDTNFKQLVNDAIKTLNLNYAF